MRSRRPSAIICSFAGAVGHMRRADQASPMKVLAVLQENPRFSVFGATENDTIARVLTNLQRDGYIEYGAANEKSGYPWCVVDLTDKAIYALGGVAKAQAAG